MAPSFYDGDYVISIKYLFFKNFGGQFGSPRVGQIAIVDHPEFGRIIKRIEEISSEEKVRLMGESLASMSSEHMGWIALEHVHSRAFLAISSNRLPRLI